MHIRSIAVTVPNDQQPPSLPFGSVNPNCFLSKGNPRTLNSPNQVQAGSECLARNTIARIRHLCDGRNTCHIPNAQMQQNLTECVHKRFPIWIEYQCLPDPDTIQFEAICADTYVDAKCDAQRTVNAALVILAARLERQLAKSPVAHRPECAPSQMEVKDDQCNYPTDVTDTLRSECNGLTSCSVSPNTVLGFKKHFPICGKMYLSLTYVCVPSEWIFARSREVAQIEFSKRNKNQRPINGLHISRTKPLNDPVTKDSPARDTRQSDYVSAERTQEGNQIPPMEQKEVVTVEHPPEKSIMVPAQGFTSTVLQPLFIGVGVGISVLLLAVVLVALACQQNRRPFRYKTSLTNGLGRLSGLHSPSPTPRTVALETCVHTDHWPRPNRTCATCIAFEEQRAQKTNPMLDVPYTEKCCCMETGSHHTLKCNTMDESYHTRYHPYPNATSICGQQALSATTYVTPTLALNAEALQVTSTNTQYLFGIQSGSSMEKVSHPFVRERNSLSQSNSSSSGVCMDGNHALYGPAFPMTVGTGLSVDPRANRVESSIYAGTGVLKCSSLAESSSGRGCDGGSGVSELNETYPVLDKSYLPNVYNEQSQHTDQLLSHTNTAPYSSDLLSTNPYLNFKTLGCGNKPSLECSEYSQTVTLHRSPTSTTGKSKTDLSPKPRFQYSVESRSATKSRTALSVNSASGSAEHSSCSPEYRGQFNGENVSRQPSKRHLYFPTRSTIDSLPPGSSKTNVQDEIDNESIESMTEQLLEPPSNFRSAPRQSPSKIPTHFTSACSNETLSPMDTPPDLLLKTHAIFDDSNECVEEPPPPIAPLRVLNNPLLHSRGFRTNTIGQTSMFPLR